MSQSIWTRCGASSNVRPLALRGAFRVVESQHVTSTRKLVDSNAEQEPLEELLEGVKPPVPLGPDFQRLHYLLYTPFRHPPLRYGSRFGVKVERGIWYGAKELSCAFAEVAYYRLLFLEGTAAELGTVIVELSAFAVPIRTKRGVDLTAPPFDAFEAQLASKTRYDASQAMGVDMRAAGVDAFLYVSARDPARGTNVGLFRPVFTVTKPKRLDTWTCTATRDKVELKKKDLLSRGQYTYPREDFLVRGKLPRPAT